MKRVWSTLYRAFLVLTLLGACVFASAQTDRATITGMVTDPTGAVLSGAHVTLTDEATGLTSSWETNREGIYTAPGLPVGTYTLSVTGSGFKAFQQTGIILVAAQVLQDNVQMTLGASGQTVTVTGGAPLLDTVTSSVATTMEETAIETLPLNASSGGGQDAVNLMLSVTPGVTGSNGSNQNFIAFSGMQAMTSSIYLNGIESTSGLQGVLATPSRDALQEMQFQTSPSDAEFSTASVEMFQIKSGSNRFHGRAFEILQNEDLNANGWANNYFLAQCSPSDTKCVSNNSRPLDRFSDYGFSGGGPIRKNHDFIFGSYEFYTNTNDSQSPNSQTVPTAKMLSGDFSELLTGGSHQGTILNADGQPWINPCTGTPYQYGQIFDPQKQQTINGVTCSTPFERNMIPPGRISSTAKNVAAIYSKNYAPTLSTRIYNNYPSYAGRKETKRMWDFKFDHTFSDRHRLSASFDRITWTGLGISGAFDEPYGPFSSMWSNKASNSIYQVTDTFSITPQLVNTIGLEYSQFKNFQTPLVHSDNAASGFNADSDVFPVLSFGGSNGIGINGTSTTTDSFYGYYAYHYQDTMYWTTGLHNVKFGGTIMARELNANFGGNIESFSFASDTGGPTDPGLTPWVGNGFVSAMLGNVQSARKAITQSNYPRQKSLGLFIQDDYRIRPKLTLNLGIRWDYNFRGHEQAGRWQNFDITANNPTWGNTLGAWDFASSSSDSFFKNEVYRQFAPRVGGAYELSQRLVARASYGLYFIPLETFNSGFGSSFPANQNSLSFPTSQVLNSTEGSTAFNWDNGYPGVPTLGPQNNTNTNIGSTGNPLYIHPDILHLGHTQNWYGGLQYALSQHSAVNISYIANRGRNLHSAGMSLMQNYPDFSVYDPVLLAGNINSTVSSAADAARIDVPYPYPGFSGPAYAAIAPFPQIARYGDQVTTSGAPQYSAVSSYNALVVEVKARDTHGLYLDFSYTLSKETGNYSPGNGDWGGGTNSYGQNYDDWRDSKHWVQPNDQRHVLKGYLTYALPIGRNRRWLSESSRLLDTLVGGWELGYYGAYESGTPMGEIGSSYSLPFYYCCDRAFLAPGQSINSPSNHFKGHLDLGNLSSPSNTDFDKKLFVATTPQKPFGNTPNAWNNWRWNSQPAQENISLNKHFNFSADGRYQFVLSAQFFNAFNRHYFGGPDTGLSDVNFGQITSISGNRTGQVSAKFSF